LTQIKVSVYGVSKTRTAYMEDQKPTRPVNEYIEFANACIKKRKF